jgi:hypothetical protein
MPAKSQATAKRQAVVKAFGNIPIDDSQDLNFLYRRRHLAMVRNGGWREPRYIAEFYELEQTILDTLDRIRERDGAKIAMEVADRLAGSIAVAGPKFPRRGAASSVSRAS